MLRSDALLGWRSRSISTDSKWATVMTRNYIDDHFDLGLDFRLCQETKLGDGDYQVVIAHPECLISSKYGRELLLSEKYQDNVVSIVVDEVRCIVDS